MRLSRRDSGYILSNVAGVPIFGGWRNTVALIVTLCDGSRTRPPLALRPNLEIQCSSRERQSVAGMRHIVQGRLVEGVDGGLAAHDNCADRWSGSALEGPS